MAKPKYIICCESLSHDKVTNLVSCYFVLEGFTLTTVGIQPGEQMPPELIERLGTPFIGVLRFVGMAVWERTDDDAPEQQIDYQLSVSIPGQAPLVVREDTADFSLRFHRFTANVELPVPLNIPAGDIVFTSKIRHTGTEEWLSQEFSIPVSVNLPPELRPE